MVDTIARAWTSRLNTLCVKPNRNAKHLNTLRTGDEDLRFYITTVQDG